MNRKAKYAINGVLWGSLIGALINAIKQFNRIDRNPKEKFDWGELLKSTGKGALIGGGAGFVAGAIVDEINVNQKPIDTDAYLTFYVESIMVDKNSGVFKASEKKCEEIIKFLEYEFRDELSTVPFQWDSNIKGIAIKGKSDFDIRVGFSKGSFKMTEMHKAVYEAFKEKFQDNSIVDVREQGKSTGLLFMLCGEEVRIDIVPMRYTDDNPNNSSANLYVKPNGWFDDSSYIKTDISLQVAEKLTQTQKKVIMILKKWKSDNNIPMSSYMIQLFVQRAYRANKNKIPGKFTDKLLMVVKYIRENIYTIRLTSIENTNNNVNDISDSDKNTIQSELKKILDEYEYHPNTLQEIFSIES